MKLINENTSVREGAKISSCFSPTDIFTTITVSYQNSGVGFIKLYNIYNPLGRLKAILEILSKGRA